METIERVCRVLCSERHEDPDQQTDGLPHWHQHRKTVFYVLDALREGDVLPGGKKIVREGTDYMRGYPDGSTRG